MNTRASEIEYITDITLKKEDGTMKVRLLRFFFLNLDDSSNPIFNHLTFLLQNKYFFKLKNL